ncbi:winged helix-turn-helix transcriptional regulator [Rhodobacteraceae bacterium F11138]|nr:winged helix-turn-helix transcriptional regulator [Rhodobacteraceae bacterium F11138]
MDSSIDEQGTDPAPQSLGELGLQRFAPYLMNRIIGRYNASLQQQLAEAGLSTAKMRVLAVLATRGGLMVNELSVHCVIEQSTMSRTLTTMLDEGLIRREEDARDSRARRIHLTDQGRDLFETMWPYMSAATEQLFVGIDDQERDAFVSTLNRILRNIRKHPI